VCEHKQKSQPLHVHHHVPRRVANPTVAAMLRTDSTTIAHSKAPIWVKTCQWARKHRPNRVFAEECHVLENEDS